MVSWDTLYHQQVEGDDPSPLLNPGEKHQEYCVQFWAHKYKTDMDTQDQSQ